MKHDEGILSHMKQIEENKSHKSLSELQKEPFAVIT